VNILRGVWTVGLSGLLMIALVAGCGGPKRPQTVAVSGTVTLDGKPVEGATVGFIPEGGGRPATGTTDASGAFTLTTFEPGDGAVVGKHSVTVSKVRGSGQQGDQASTASGPGPGPGPGAMPLSGMPEAGGVKLEWIVPKKYSEPANSGLKVEVRSGLEPVKLDLSSK
jgi:hypothetical protein